MSHMPVIVAKDSLANMLDCLNLKESRSSKLDFTLSEFLSASFSKKLRRISPIGPMTSEQKCSHTFPLIIRVKIM